MAARLDVAAAHTGWMSELAWSTGALGFVAGLTIAVVTAPVGVSGAMFLLPVQLSVLGVPSPAVTPTNLLFNVVATPGALLRYRRQGGLRTPLARRLVLGTLPGVVVGAVIRVFAVPGPQVFRLFVAGLLLPLGVWLCARTLRPARRRPAEPPSPRAVTALAVAVGIVGGVYGIGGGSLLGPMLVGRGLPVVQVAPAALASTFLTSIVGAGAFALLALVAPGAVAPYWSLGLLCGLGGLVGGYVGARLQPYLPETGLRLLLGVLAALVGVLYTVQALI
ncbi:sulfite exporter TauE/SafE family protein [Micromonospora sp. NPDC047074]|uniref:sulfite exporter TauE/SafE family protein n=1 Tax=Micromonospora sp. NPDC047074 TaxID=3154339 RepID=UPI0033E01F6C